MPFKTIASSSCISEFAIFINLYAVPNFKLYISAISSAETLQVGKKIAYKVIRKLNSELEEKGYETIRGRINKKYFLERYRLDEGGKMDASIQG